MFGENESIKKSLCACEQLQVLESASFCHFFKKPAKTKVAKLVSGALTSARKAFLCTTLGFGPSVVIVLHVDYLL